MWICNEYYERFAYRYEYIHFTYSYLSMVQHTPSNERMHHKVFLGRSERKVVIQTFPKISRGPVDIPPKRGTSGARQWTSGECVARGVLVSVRVIWMPASRNPCQTVLSDVARPRDQTTQNDPCSWQHDRRVTRIMLLSIHPYRPSLSTGHLNCILCLQRVVVDRFFLAVAGPCIGVYRRRSLMSSSEHLQQCPAGLVRLTWMALVKGAASHLLKVMSVFLYRELLSIGYRSYGSLIYQIK